MIDLKIKLTDNILKVIPSVSYNDSVLNYKIRYTSGISDVTNRYVIKYHSYQLSEYKLQVPFKNTYVYDDSVQRYHIFYHSGRDTSDFTTTYRIKYVSDNPVNARQIYRIIYDSEVRLNDIVQPYRIKYTSWHLNSNITPYLIRYQSIGVGDIEHRKRWTIKYNSQSLGDFSTTYKIKYTASVFYDNAIRYLIRYSSQGSERILTRAALVERPDGKFDAILQVRGTLNYSIDNYFFVLANMPKYQHVEYTIGDELPYVDYIRYNEVEDLFGTVDNGRYEVKGYLVLKDIDPRNSVSIDVYDNTDYKRANRAKSYFFDIEPTAWNHVNMQFKGMQINKINYASDNYEYNYLNFVSTEVTPTFNPGEDCCFSRKILPPGSPNISSGCSPF